MIKKDNGMSRYIVSFRILALPTASFDVLVIVFFVGLDWWSAFCRRVSWTRVRIHN